MSQRYWNQNVIGCGSTSLMWLRFCYWYFGLALASNEGCDRGHWCYQRDAFKRAASSCSSTYTKYWRKAHLVLLVRFVNILPWPRSHGTRQDTTIDVFDSRGRGRSNFWNVSAVDSKSCGCHTRLWGHAMRPCLCCVLYTKHLSTAACGEGAWVHACTYFRQNDIQLMACCLVFHHNSYR